MNEQNRYRGSGAERDRNDERSWRRDDDGSLLDRGDHPREAWSRERAGQNEWQRDYGSRSQAQSRSEAYDHMNPDFSRYGGRQPGPFREQDRGYRGENGGYGRNRDWQQEWSGFSGPSRFDEPERERTYPSHGSNGPSHGSSAGPNGAWSHGSSLGSRARGALNYSSSAQTGGFAGRGPKGYTRSDERIREDVCEHLSENDEVDASDIEVAVKERKVTLTGTVENRRMKHLAEDIAEMVSGVLDVDNRVTVRKPLLKDMADRIMGKEPDAHYANTGTKDTSATGSMHGANGRP